MNNNIKDILEAFYYNNPETKQQAKNLGVTVEDYTELKAYEASKTKEGKLVYSRIMQILNGCIN